VAEPDVKLKKPQSRDKLAELKRKEKLLKRIKYLKELIRKIEELKLKKQLRDQQQQLKSKERPRFRHEDMKPYTDGKGISYVWNPEMMNYCP
jgi:hypothetical protein